MALISCNKVLTDKGWFNNMEIEVSNDGLITDIRPLLASKTPQYAKTPQYDCLLPAPCNLHSHSFQRALAGLTEMRGQDIDDSFWSWRKLMYSFLNKLTPEHIEGIAKFVFMEMLEAGYAAVAEFHYLHNALGGNHYSDQAELSKRIISAAEETGIGLTLLPVLYQYGGADLRPLQGGQLRFKNDFESYQTLFESAQMAVASSKADFEIGVAPHSLRAVDEQGIKDIITLAAHRNIHMHLAEQIAEVEEIVAIKFMRPTKWLLENVDVGKRWCLIHCTQMNLDETRNLAKTGAVAGLCPITESSLGDGIFEGVAFLGAGGHIGLGSDSNIHISLFDEITTLEYSQRLRDKSRAVLATDKKSTARSIFDNICIGGAQALGRNSGRIKIGQFSDLVAIDTDNPYICGRKEDYILESLTFGGHGQSCITDVWSAGRHVVKNGQHIHKHAISAIYKAICKELGYGI